jgi:dipeptidyl-peptidase 4
LAGEERLLADPRVLLGGEAEVIPAAELRRRERSRESARGIVAYSTDSAGRLAAFALSGRLFACDLETGETRAVPAGGECVDPHIDPAGVAIAYVHERSLRVVTLDGEIIVELSDDDPEVSYGAADSAAAEEQDRHHGFWWSPDGRRLLAARVDTSDVTACWLSDPTYNEETPALLRYPRAGYANAIVRLVVAGLDGSTVAVTGAPDERLPYLTSARWEHGGPPTLVLLACDQHLAERDLQGTPGASALFQEPPVMTQTATSRRPW